MAIAPAAASAATVTDDSVGDFAAGTVDGAATVVAPGSVQIQHTTEGFDAGFPGTLNATENEAGGTATVASSALSVDGDNVKATALYSPDTVAEFSAKFSGAEFQHVGLGTVLDLSAPFAIFTSGGAGNQLSARTFTPATGDTVTVLGATVNATHTFRINWSPTQVDYYVDDVKVASHMVAIGTQMSPLISDLHAPSAGTGSVIVDSMHVYRANPGTFTSRVFDAGDAHPTWGALSPTTAGNVTIETSTGNTPTPDSSWSAFQPLTSGAIASPRARYIRYRATLIDNTASLDKVTIDYTNPAPPAQGGGTQSGGSQSGGSQGGSPSGGNSTVDKTAPKVTLLSKSLRASKGGTVAVQVGCPAGETSCKITVQLKRGSSVLAKKTVTVRGGKTKTVTLQLAKAARKQLAGHHSLTVTAVLAASDAAGNKKTTKKSLTLRG
jgi:hypothetical protein